MKVFPVIALSFGCLLRALSGACAQEPTPAEPDIPTVLTQQDNTLVVFSSGYGKTVSASNADFAGYLYVREPAGCAGIRVHYTGDLVPARGTLVDISGLISTGPDGEREIDAGTDGLTMDYASRALSMLPNPMTMSNRYLGGADFSEYTPGVTRPVGLGCYNKGLLVKTLGRVSFVDSTNGFLYIDDGSRLKDGSGHIGVKVNWGWPVARAMTIQPQVGWYISVVGISGSESDGQGGYVRVLRPRDRQDIVILNPQDTSVPSVAITTPGTGTLQKDPNLGTALIAGTASDPDTGVAHVEVAVVLQGQAVPAHPWQMATYAPPQDDSQGTWTFNWSGVSAGTYTIYASATDFFGNSAETSMSNVTVSKFPSTLVCISLNCVCPPDDGAPSAREANWQFEMSHVDMAIGSYHMAGLRARNSDINLLQYKLLNTLIIGDEETTNALQSYADANSYDVEDAFLHFYDDTTVRYSDGTTEDIPGWGGGSAVSRWDARMKGNIYGFPRWYFNLKSPLTRGFWGNQFRSAVTTGLKPDGIFVDENSPFYSSAVSPYIVSGGHIVEYDNRGKGDSQMLAEYDADQVATYAAVNDAMGHDDPLGDHLLIPSVGQYVYEFTDLGTQGADGLATELYVDEGEPIEPQAYSYAQLFAAAGKIFTLALEMHSPSEAITDPGNYSSVEDRHQMYGLTEYWIAKQGSSTYYAQLGPSGNTSDTAVNAGFAGTLDTTTGQNLDFTIEPGRCFYTGAQVRATLDEADTWFQGIVNSCDPITGAIEITIYTNDTGPDTGTIASGNWHVGVTSSWWGPLSSFWSKACEFDLGNPIDQIYATWQTGGSDDYEDVPYYEIYKREYENAILFSRPQHRWLANPDYTTEVQVDNLPEGSYQVLHWDGTLGPPITSIGLAMGEAVTLVKVRP